MAFSSVAHLARRGEVFYFRRAIPKALAPIFGRRELKLSLGTDERATATRRCRDLANAFEQMLGKVQGMTALTQDQIDGLLRAYFERQWQKANETAAVDSQEREFNPAHEAECAKEEADILRQRVIARQYHDAITGHAGGGVGRRYGKNSLPLKVLDKAMRRVSFDVDLCYLLPG